MEKIILILLQRAGTAFLQQLLVLIAGWLEVDETSTMTKDARKVKVLAANNHVDGKRVDTIKVKRKRRLIGRR